MGHGIQNQDDNEVFNFDNDLVKLEESLTPWNISKNFINATQMRAMVQIHGAGDPTGCGEGFSFLKTSMKGGFLKSTTSLANLAASSPAPATKKALPQADTHTTLLNSRKYTRMRSQEPGIHTQKA